MSEAVFYISIIWKNHIFITDEKITFFWNELKATFWFVPVLIILFSILLAIGFVYTDQIATFSRDGPGRFFFVHSVDSARSILSTISGAMIGVAGTVFSVTLVALTLASSQLGPRLIKNFMYVRLSSLIRVLVPSEKSFYIQA